MIVVAAYYSTYSFMVLRTKMRRSETASIRKSNLESMIIINLTPQLSLICFDLKYQTGIARK